MSHVRCHVSRDTCQVSGDTCQAELCDIYCDATVSADIGYLSDIVTIRIRHSLTILGLYLTDQVRPDLDLTQHITNLTLLKIKNYPNIAGYRPKLP